MDTIRTYKDRLVSRKVINPNSKVRDKTKQDWIEFSDKLDNKYQELYDKAKTLDKDSELAEELNSTLNILSDLRSIVNRVISSWDERILNELLDSFNKKNKVTFRFGKLNYKYDEYN